MCRTGLSHTHHDAVDAWVCPTGHGLTIIPTEAHGAEDALSRVWQQAESAAPGIRRCPSCEGEMAVVSLEGDAPVKADVCPLCEVLWFDSLEIEGLPADQPDTEALVRRALERPAIKLLLERTPSHV
jgi:hypothetical protein